MKIEPRRADAFLAAPGACRVVLLYGEDAGLVRERGTALVRRVAGSADDAFMVTELERDRWAMLGDEMAQQGLFGGRRVVRVRDATDAATVGVQAALAGQGDAMAVVEAGDLQKKSRLRSVVETAPGGAAIACYAEEGADLARTIVSILGQCGVRPSADAAEFLAGNLGNDRSITRQELVKLALYVDPATEVTLDDAMALIGDHAGLELADALFSATAGDVAAAERALGAAMAEGAAPVMVLRRLLVHLQRLEQVVLAMRSGSSADDAVGQLQPRVFYTQKRLMLRASGLWGVEGLAQACAAVWDAERACKQTGAPDELLCRHAVLAVARRARQSVERRGR